MSARENILHAIEANQPELVHPPIINLNDTINYDNLLDQFCSCLKGIGGTTIRINSLDKLKSIIEKEKESGQYIINTIEEVTENLKELKASDLAGVKKAYIQGAIAVAENGCIWVYESQMENRILPFIAEHLAIVVLEKDIVANMHYALQKINIAKEGFGSFIAGPSKTADIEQSLVIGAHGARSLEVYIIV